eukprot:CAMPEP_0196665268 /NCGR_PEP_ID=MMETSP1086-20130531/60200_1 /TAXON_ID=77921 /ORGANISM="Cyanoptyche  gloeocystis , Strain SAG4.97" /LENGTH=91 /DNA_ID=CAMNT_0042001917 /DNA_START=241 /DNA_END=513 /DNA_ORIENTATION=-
MGGRRGHQIDLGADVLHLQRNEGVLAGEPSTKRVVVPVLEVVARDPQLIAALQHQRLLRAKVSENRRDRGDELESDSRGRDCLANLYLDRY